MKVVLRSELSVGPHQEPGRSISFVVLRALASWIKESSAAFLIRPLHRLAYFRFFFFFPSTQAVFSALNPATFSQRQRPASVKLSSRSG